GRDPRRRAGGGGGGGIGRRGGIGARPAPGGGAQGQGGTTGPARKARAASLFPLPDPPARRGIFGAGSLGASSPLPRHGLRAAGGPRRAARGASPAPRGGSRPVEPAEGPRGGHAAGR